MRFSLNLWIAGYQYLIAYHCVTIKVLTIF